MDANYLNRGELELAHIAGVEVEAAKATEVLSALRAIWGRPVHLFAVINEEQHLLTLSDVGGKVTRESVTDDTPAPAHVLA